MGNLALSTIDLDRYSRYRPFVELMQWRWGLCLAILCFCGFIIAAAARAAAACFAPAKLTADAAADEKHAGHDDEKDDDVLPHGGPSPGFV
ncbi:MAG: hypothetical protein WCV64_08500 [Desulfurivibrionaceae bacterium]|jgi:hypothetical protein